MKTSFLWFILVSLYASTNALICEVCYGDRCGTTSSVRECSSIHNFCKSVVENKANGSSNIVKGCASMPECQEQWELKAECLSYNMSMTYYYDFSCSYCCAKDECNMKIVPSPDSLIIGTTTPTPTTTRTPKMSTASVTRSCYQCGDKQLGLYCEGIDIFAPSTSQCAPGEYCMTDVFLNTRGQGKFMRRCASLHDCRKDWYADTSDQPICTDSANPALVRTTATCHYCCTKDNCNIGTIPLRDTLYKG